MHFDSSRGTTPRNTHAASGPTTDSTHYTANDRCHRRPSLPCRRIHGIECAPLPVPAVAAAVSRRTSSAARVSVSDVDTRFSTAALAEYPAHLLRLRRPPAL